MGYREGGYKISFRAALVLSSFDDAVNKLLFKQEDKNVPKI